MRIGAPIETAEYPVSRKDELMERVRNEVAALVSWVASPECTATTAAVFDKGKSTGPTPVPEVMASDLTFPKTLAEDTAASLKESEAELKRIGRPALPVSRATDTLDIARRKFPGAQNSLDALCRRFGVDNSGRTKHGALLDAQAYRRSAS